MKVTVTTLEDAIFNLDVSEDLELENFKAFCEVESGIPSSQILIVLNGRPLTDDKKSLKEHGVKEGDVVIMQNYRQTTSNTSTGSTGYGFNVPSATSSDQGFPKLDFSGIQVPGRSGASGSGKSSRSSGRTAVDEDDPAFIRDALLKDPQQLSLVKQNNPALAEALTSGDFEKFSKMIRDMQKLRKEREEQRVRLLAADSFDIEAQRLIADEIRQKNIDANMEAAMEFNPESFGTVVMLYVNCKVNGHPVKAFIDSGAQTTIMSTECAERCAIMRLVDVRFSGIAKGVGTQRIIGRIHMTQIQIGDVFLQSSFSVLQDQKMDMLLGLDMLKRHQCTIDLRRNVLMIGTYNTETPFLPESELPDSARLTSTNPESAMEEEALANLGEDAGLARAIEESVREQSKGKGSRPKSRNGSGVSSNKKPRH